MGSIQFLNPDSDEKLLSARICDIAKKAENGKIGFTRFLNLRQQEIAEISTLGFDVSTLFYGGFQESERKVLGIFKPCFNLSDKDFPICVFKLSYSKKAIFSHRDVLGALMSLGIERDCIGDIHFSEDECYFSSVKSISNTILSNLQTVAKYTVTPSVATVFPDFKDETEEKCTVVSSLRLDAVVAAIIGKSRAVSAELINKQKVFVNDKESTKVDEEVKLASVISIRGFGKFKLSPAISKTSKNKIRITILKYI